jgi:tRNA(fMet)-specific endonuclease VapC
VIYLLDTKILIYLIKNRPLTIAQKVNSLPTDAKLGMSFITWAELLKGAERNNRKQETLRRLDQLAQQILVMYPGGPTICKHYAEQFVQLKDSGIPIGANDLWIACHALAENATLVTHNSKEFLRVKGLAVEDWVVE